MCRQFRECALHILFESVDVAFERRIIHRGQTFLEFLNANSHVADSVKSMTFWPTTTLEQDGAGQQQIFKQLLPTLTHLREIRIQELDSSTLFIIDALRQSRRSVDVVVAHHVFGDVYQGIASDQLQKYLELQASLSLTLAASMSAEKWNMIKHILFGVPTLRALKFRQWLNELHRVAVPPSRLDYNTLLSTAYESLLLEEFHANDVLLQESNVTSGVASCFHAVQWSSLRRLSLSGRAMVEDVFPRVASRLENLERLHLKSPNPQSFLFAVGLVGSAYDNSVRVKAHPELEASPFLKLIKLTELTLDGVSAALPIEYIAQSSLENLCLHLRETLITVKTKGCRSVEDLRLLNTLAPSITQLQLDIGDIDNLWHPTAVLGVDVAPDLYQILNAITSFSRLKSLRLFPKYIANGTQRDRSPRYKQPLSDEQAVRLFQRLKIARPTLEVVLVVADPIIARDADIDCFAWEMRAVGNQVILVTRQANKDYEVRQVWEGTRRLRWETKRYSYHKPYLREPKGWIFSD